MDQKEIANAILSRLYVSHFAGRKPVNLHEICEELGTDNTAFWNVAEYLSHQGLIRAHTMGGNYAIESGGILSAEEQGLVSEEVRKENQRIRTNVLDRLATLFETSGSLAEAYIESLAQELQVDVYVLVNNIQVLEDLGYTESISNGGCRITFKGLEAVKEWRQRVGFAGEYEEISKLPPQARGRALQKLIAKVIEKEGWSQKEGARTSHEEMDVVIHKQREYFLIECKWEKDPTEAAVVRELHGKLSNRVGVQGIIISISGFTSGAVKQVEDYANSRMILLFGREDMEQVIFQQSSFDSLLDERYHELVTHRKAAFQ